MTDVEEFVSQTAPCSMPQATEVDTAVPGVLAEQPSLDITLDKPFALVIKRAGALQETISLSYDSFTKEAVSIINGKEITKQVSNADEDMVKQILNNSGFFDANSFYHPAPISIDYQEFTLIATLDGKLHAIYWNDASEGVPEVIIQNLPYTTYTPRTESIF